MDKTQIINLLQQGLYTEAHTACAELCKRLPDDPEAWFLLGAINGQLGNFPEAETCCRTALRLQPNQPNLHYNLAIALFKQDKIDNAIQQFRKAIHFNPAYAEAYAELGNALQIQNKHNEALDSYKKALHYKPDMVNVYFNAGNIHRKSHRPEEAITCYRQAIQLQPDLVAAYIELSEILIGLYRFLDTITLLNKAVTVLPDIAAIHHYLGIAHQEQGDIERALSCHKQALALDPKHEGAQASIAGILGLQGNFQEAHALLLPLVDRPLPNLTAMITYGYFANKFNSEDDAIFRIDKCLLREDFSSETRIKLHFAAAKIFDRRNQYTAAFDHYRLGNELKRTRYEIKHFIKLIDALETVYSKDSISKLPRASNNSNLPVFILGMPRSGTSLVEQILASHPMVFGAGELHAINELALSLPAALGSKQPYPLCITTGNQAAFNTIARQYINDLATRTGGNFARATDKMPNNFIHLGLIDVLFPGARIIHCKRDPMDTCISCFFHNFSGEHAYAYDLKYLGSYYRQYIRLMEHWRNVLRLPMLEVCYEDLIANPEQASKSLIEFCELPWDSQCLRFYETQRTVATASYDQVRQPIYDSSIGRWKHYEQFLDPLKDALGIYE